jgi:hypothetical protein
MKICEHVQKLLKGADKITDMISQVLSFIMKYKSSLESDNWL